jgi:hypothetical protein
MSRPNLDTSREAYLAAICQRQIVELADKTNVWWAQTGGDGRDLVTPFDIANQVYRWCLETGRPVRLHHDHPSVIFGELAATWEAEREVCKAEARRYVMEQATWRRILMEEPAMVRPEPMVKVVVGKKTEGAVR